ncbi:MAG: response regulator [Deltaproteobacteria bacterium]|mgnify:FL=1|nr:response regulator [Deltaproteobacteria bacterium]MBT4525497.1 response regulator [Deltaproteobacteria bacterium]
MRKLLGSRVFTALSLLLTIITFGTVGYVLIENYTVVEAFYMVIISITTVGFGEVKPLSDIGRLFTAVLILIGIGSIGFIGTSIVESVIQRIWTGRAGLLKMKKKINKLKSHFIVCGFGRVGEAAVEEFERQNASYVVIEPDHNLCEKMTAKGYLFIQGDATREEVLLEAGIKSAKGLLALLSSDPNNLFISLTSRELNPTLHIIARGEEKSSEKRILQAGADRVISPFLTAGRRIADDILTDTGILKVKPVDSAIFEMIPQWISVQEGSSMIGQTVQKISDEMGREIIGLRVGDTDYIFPESGTIINATDMLLVVAEAVNEEKSGETTIPSNPPKIVIIDDNIVILRLYVRLFQKAGFNPLTAMDGEQGLQLIREEKPVAAIIDYMLPNLSGIEVCQEVRKDPKLKAVKLVLFTGDETSETKKKALKAGADEVVRKTPEAFEIIQAAIKLINKKDD